VTGAVLGVEGRLLGRNGGRVLGLKLIRELGLFVQVGLCLLALRVHRVGLGLGVGNGVVVLLGRPRGALCGLVGLRGKVGVGLGDRAQELEAIGELRHRVRRQQRLVLGAHVGVGLHRTFGEPPAGLGGVGLGGLLHRLGLGEVLLSLLQLVTGLVPLLVQRGELLLQLGELGLGVRDVLL
jgi:hypothetical protein